MLGVRQTEPARVYRVAELNRRVRLKMERWGEVWVEGELSEVSRAASGHLYFTLTDGAEQAQLRAVMFRGDARFARAKMIEGERVRVLGALSLYEPRGTFQLLVRVALAAGEGDRAAELEKLKKKLAAEGLFARERKRPLPRYPSVIGLVTSKEGAAVHDVVRVAAGRAPVRLVVSHCQVQGPEAPLSIVRAIRRVCRLPGLDVIIVTRGGGAADDLGAFNDERVARAIAACPVPVVSGVGHEIDETIADLVADVRAATPSNAAELVVPDGAALRGELDALRRRLERGLEVRVGRHRLSLERLARRVSDPRRALGGVRHRFVASRADVERAVGRVLAQHRARLTALTHRLGRLDPRAALARDRAALVGLAHRLASVRRPLIEDRRRALTALDASLRVALGPPLTAARAALVGLDARVKTAASPALTEKKSELARLAARLNDLSPLGILARGYAIALYDGRALLSSGEVSAGDRLDVRLSRGSLLAEVVRVDPPEGDA